MIILFLYKKILHLTVNKLIVQITGTVKSYNENTRTTTLFYMKIYPNP